MAETPSPPKRRRNRRSRHNRLGALQRLFRTWVGARAVRVAKSWLRRLRPSSGPAPSAGPPHGPGDPPLAPIRAQRPQPHPPGFREKWRGRAFTALFLVCALLLAKPWLSRLTQLHAEMISAAAPAALGGDDARVATVLIDAPEYQQQFDATSPLNRAALAAFFMRFVEHHDRLRSSPRCQTCDADRAATQGLPSVLGIDFDLAPANPADLDSQARQQLDRALDLLAARVPLVLVWPVFDAACRSDPSACAACRWVAQRQAHQIHFASALLDDRGASFNRSRATLGVVMAQLRNPASAAAAAAASASASAPAPPAVAVAVAEVAPDMTVKLMSWVMKEVASVTPEKPCDARAAQPQADACKACDGAHGSHPGDSADETVQRIDAMLNFNFGAAAQDLNALMDHMVVVGGAYDPRDTLWPAGQPLAMPSAQVHAWVAASAARPYRELKKWALIGIEVAFGMLAGAVFHAIWAAVGRARPFFFKLAFWYGVFWVITLAPPLGLLLVANDLQRLGLDALSLGLLTIGIGLDSVVSAHDELLQDLPEPVELTPKLAALERFAEFSWGFGQWWVILTVLFSHPHALPPYQALLICAIAAGCYFWPGGPRTQPGPRPP